MAGLRAHRGRGVLRPARLDPRVRPRLDDSARLEPADPGHTGPDDLDDRLLPGDVLRAEAVRVRPDPGHDRRAAPTDPGRTRRGRPRPGRGAQARRGAPRRDGSGPEPGGRHPRRGTQGRGVAEEAAARRARGGPPAAPRGDDAPDRVRDGPRLGGDPLRGRGPDGDRHAEGDRQGPDRRRPQAPHRRGDRRARLLGSSAREPELGMAVVARTYARALFEAAQERGRIDEVRDELGSFLAAVDEVPELRSLIRNPELDPPEKAKVLTAVLADADELVRNFVRVVTEKGRATMLDEIMGEYDRLVAAEAKILSVELTTAYELSDDEAAAIVKQIEDASGRRVEAARTVDPNLIGGLVLKAGSLEVDSSVRGRLDRLRRNLAHAST